jgi:hypothetical protein
MALASVSAGTKVFTQARADRLVVEEVTARSRMPLAVVAETTSNAFAPVLDHCDQAEGNRPRGVELKLSMSQGDAEGASRDSKISRRGMMREADFLFMTSPVLGVAAATRTWVQPNL